MGAGDRFAREVGPLGMSWISPSRAMSSTGTSTRRSSTLRAPALTMVTGRKRGPEADSSSPPATSIKPAGTSPSTLATSIGDGACDLAEGVCSSAPPRKRATSSSGRCVALRPMRWMRLPGWLRETSASRRSSESAMCAPRLLGTSAWISSTMTVSTVRSCSEAAEVSIR
jgi:hypothetical protein